VAFDPSHDAPIDFRGKPSLNVQNVFTWMDPGSATVSINTSDQLGNGTWDTTLPFNVCITTYPIGQFVALNPGTCYGSIRRTTSGVDESNHHHLLSRGLIPALPPT